MKTIFTALCILIASMTASYADSYDKGVLKDGEVIASFVIDKDVGHREYLYTVKYLNDLFMCSYNFRDDGINCVRIGDDRGTHYDFIYRY